MMLKLMSHCWRLLGRPWCYQAFKALLRGSFAQTVLSEHIRAHAGARVLDIGCGTGDLLETLPKVDYTGFDVNADYIAAAKRRCGGNGTFIHMDVNQSLVGLPRDCDIVLAIGVIHHLSDLEVLHLLQLAKSCLKRGGRLVTLDGAFVRDQSCLERWALGLDRGRFVRSEEQYLALVNQVFPENKHTIYHGQIRIPYCHIVVECPK